MKFLVLQKQFIKSNKFEFLRDLQLRNIDYKTYIIDANAKKRRMDLIVKMDFL